VELIDDKHSKYFGYIDNIIQIDSDIFFLINLIAINEKATLFNGLNDVTQKHCDRFFVDVSG